MRSNLFVIVHILYFLVASFVGLFLVLFLIFSLFSVFIDLNSYFDKEIYSILKDSFNLSLRGAILLSLVPLLRTLLYLCRGRKHNK